MTTVRENLKVTPKYREISHLLRRAGFGATPARSVRAFDEPGQAPGSDRSLPRAGVCVAAQICRLGLLQEVRQRFVCDSVSSCLERFF